MASAGNLENPALLKKLEQDYPAFRFCLNQERFLYRPGTKTKKPTIFLGPPEENFALLALHELGHALCKHKNYQTHVERLKIESEAWEAAKTVYEKYAAEHPELLKNQPWDEDFVQDQLDTYRNWLHTKSRCKNCGLTRYQTADGAYHCPRCENFC